MAADADLEAMARVILGDGSSARECVLRARGRHNGGLSIKALVLWEAREALVRGESKSDNEEFYTNGSLKEWPSVEKPMRPDTYVELIEGCYARARLHHWAREIKSKMAAWPVDLAIKARVLGVSEIVLLEGLGE